MVTLQFDGCCLPYNPGGIACGGFVLLDGNREIASGAEVVSEHGTNNEAEYAGLELGLWKAKEFGIRRMEAVGDSMLVVMQVSGEWAVKSPSMAECVGRCRKLIKGFSSFEIDWIPREENRRADRIVHKRWMDAFESRSLDASASIGADCMSLAGGGKLYVVGSQRYLVDPRKPSCSCRDFENKNRSPLLERSRLVARCKHILAAQREMKAETIRGQA